MTRNPESDLANINSALITADNLLLRALFLVCEAERLAKANCGAPDPDRFSDMEEAAARAKDHIEKAIDRLEMVVE